MSSGRQIAESKLAETREAKCFPRCVITGSPAHKASEVVVWPLTKNVSRARSDKESLLRCSGCSNSVEKMILLGSTPCFFACLFIFSSAKGLSLYNHRRLDGILFNIFIQEANVSLSTL